MRPTQKGRGRGSSWGRSVCSRRSLPSLPRAGTCQVYERLLVYDEELEKLSYAGFPDSLPHVADYPAAGDGFGIGVLCIFPDAYREGMPGVVLFSGICAVVYFVVGIRFDAVMIADTPTPIGEFAVLLMVLLFAGGMVWVYKKRWEPTRNIIGGSLGVLLVAYLISEYVVPFNLVWVQWGLCALVVGYLVFLSLSERHLSYFLIGLFALGSIGFLYSSDYFFNKVLEPINRYVSRWCSVWKRTLLVPAIT